MKKFRCPWCGEQCITALNKSYFIVKGSARSGNICPACGRRFIARDRAKFLFIPEILIFLLLILLGLKFGQGFFIAGIIYLLVLSCVAFPVYAYFMRPIMRCGEGGYKPLEIQTPFIIKTDMPVSLVAEDIFAVKFALGQRDKVLHQDLKNADLPVFLRAASAGENTYYMGFLQPDFINTESVKEGTELNLILNGGRTVSAVLVSVNGD